MDFNILIALLLQKGDCSIFSNLENQFFNQWGKQINIKIDESLNENDSICYLISNSNIEIKLQLFDYPFTRAFSLPKESIINCTNEKLDEIRNHKAHALINIGKCNIKVYDATYLIAQLLITLFKSTNALGYLNFSAQIYLGAERFKYFEKHTSLEINELFSLLISKQIIGYTEKKFLRNKEVYCIHTHGLDQFNIPDIQMKISEKEKIDYAVSVLDNIAFYSIQRGVSFGAGEKIKYGQNEAYLILDVPAEELNNHYSELGAIEISEVKI